jgi:hypothetical protein
LKRSLICEDTKYQEAPKLFGTSETSSGYLFFKPAKTYPCLLMRFLSVTFIQGDLHWMVYIRLREGSGQAIDQLEP